MISLFYQAWEKYRFAVAYERDGQDGYRSYLMALDRSGYARACSSGSRCATRRCCSSPGCCRLQPRSAAALEQILEDYFDVPVEVEQFVGPGSRWTPRPVPRSRMANRLPSNWL